MAEESGWNRCFDTGFRHLLTARTSPYNRGTVSTQTRPNDGIPKYISRCDTTRARRVLRARLVLHSWCFVARWRLKQILQELYCPLLTSISISEIYEYWNIKVFCWNCRKALNWNKFILVNMLWFFKVARWHYSNYFSWLWSLDYLALVRKEIIKPWITIMWMS